MKFLKSGLNNNQLKIIAMAAMLLDHIGKEIFPDLMILQIIGRIAFPVFAFMIAEGCSFTRNRKKYLLRLLILAFLCQLVYFIAERSLYQNVLITFSISVFSIYTIDNFRHKKSTLNLVLMLTEFAGVICLCCVLPEFIKGFHIDYGLFGVLLPVAVYLAPGKLSKICAAAFMLVLLSFDLGAIQWYSLITVFLFVFYNGKRGKINMKYLFYVFYPLHLALIYLIKQLIINL